MSSNTAAWLESPKANPLIIKSYPYKSPGRGQILIKNIAIAINPVDSKMQESDFGLTYPVILGLDVAGEVVEVGDDVTQFKPGQRVFAHNAGPLSKDPAQCGFQHYTVAPANLACAIPDTIPTYKAVVIGLGAATAAAGLYQRDFLALPLPSVTTKLGSADKIVVVWGGSSSVGGSAIQLAMNSGYEVWAVAGQRNLDYVQSLGAAKTFDYTDADIVDEIVKALEAEGKDVAGYFDAISLPDTVAAMLQIASRCVGAKMIASTIPGTDRFSTADVAVKSVFATAIAHNEVGPAIFQDFLPQALVEGRFHARPEAEVVGMGLESVQVGLDRMKRGFSGGKLVVRLSE